MSYTRLDIRTEVRDNIHESTADLWTDAQLDKYIRAETPQNHSFIRFHVVETN